MLNQAILMGRLTRDPVLRQANGVPVATFTLAIDRACKGEKRTDFIDIVAWDKLAGWCTNWLEKGVMAIVTGRIQSRSWQDRAGNHRVSVEVYAREITFGETKAARERAAQQTHAAPPASAVPPDTDPFYELSDDESDVPF